MKRNLSLLSVVALFTLFAASFGPSSPVFAQEGHWRLVHAEYGAGNSWSDVTPAVRSLIHDHQLDIRADNYTLGGDPAPGRPKTLRLRMENEHGESRVLTFPEKAVVQLSISVRMDNDDRDRRGESFGPDRHDDRRPNSDADRARPPFAHAGLRILRADYGADGRFADVTGRLASQIQGNRLFLNVNNATMGGDPADDRLKTLTVWYLFDGHPAMQVVGEHGSLAVPADADFFRGRLRIMRAQYGADFRYFDVTDRLNSLVQNDQLVMPVSNAMMGGDPAPEVHKRLTVLYIFDGTVCRAAVDERGTLEIPAGGVPIADNSSTLQILHATYGAEGRRTDVTDRLRAAVNSGQLQFFVSNDALGGDPAYGMHKTLVVVYRWNDMRYEVATPEGSTLNIP